METAKREPNYLDVAEQLISALRQQETRTKTLEREVSSQREFNANLTEKFRRLEQENKDLKERVNRLEQEKKDLEGTVKKQQETQKQEQKTDPKHDNPKLEEELRRVFGHHTYGSPDVLLWMLGRN